MREISGEKLVKDTLRVLNNPFWISTLNANEVYTRIHDDHDGTFKGNISVSIDSQGDAWVLCEQTHNRAPLRFRTFSGGGQSLRVRNALMILALAIKLDNEERQQIIGDNASPTE